MSTVKPRFAISRLPLGQALGSLFELARFPLCVSAGASALVSYWLAIRQFDLLSGRALATALAVACAIGFANVLNDIIDVEIDRINSPRRPIPAGRASVRAAWWLTGGLCVASLGLGLLAGPRMALLTAFAIAGSLAYDLWARNIALVGNALVALLCALTLAAGSTVAETGMFPAAPFVCTFLFILARELIGAVSDLAGDRAGGRRTVAMLWGAEVTLLVSMALAICSAVALCAAAWLVPARYPAAFLACAAVTTVGPVALAIAAIWRDRSADNIRTVSWRLRPVLLMTTGSFLLLV
jgi:geranylgeranylglycerol-phosphate geranylgeranyltransferase